VSLLPVVCLVAALGLAACVPAAQAPAPTPTPTPTPAVPVWWALPREETGDQHARSDRVDAATEVRVAPPPPPHLKAANTCCELSDAQIEAAIFARPSPFLDCYAAHGEDRSGKIVLALTIATDGHVKAVNVVEDEMMRPKLTSCVLSAMRSARFPRAPLPTFATFPLRFKATAV